MNPISALIPENILDNDQLKNFMKVVDGVSTYKTQTLYKYVDGFLKKVTNSSSTYNIEMKDLGFGVLPSFLVRDQLDALYINSTNIMRWKGSKDGLTLWLWCLTQGTIVLDDSLFYPNSHYIILNSTAKAFVSHNFTAVPADDDTLFLCSAADDFGTSVIDITIDTPYYNQAGLSDYINDEIIKYLGLCTWNVIVNLTLNSGARATNSLSPSYFEI